MKKWGVVVTLVYAAVVLGVVAPLAGSLFLSATQLRDMYDDVAFWMWVAALVGCQALLLFLRVDTSVRRPERRSHIAVSAIATGLAVALLTIAAVEALLLAGLGEDSDASGLMLDNGGRMLASVAILWSVWSVIFYRRLTHAVSPLDHALRWLVKGSVLELLIVVPCHVIVRRRGDCSAPALTAFGIATGVAVMLLAFGPSILFLIEERRRQYKSSARPAQR